MIIATHQMRRYVPQSMKTKSNWLTLRRFGLSWTRAYLVLIMVGSAASAALIACEREEPIETSMISPEATAARASLPSATPILVSITTRTPTPTEALTDTPTPIPTDTATPAPTDTASPIPTDTATPLRLPTDTATPVPTATPSPLALPTDTATPVPTATPSPLALPTDTATPVPTATPSPLALPTDTATPEPTATPSPLALPTDTATPEPTVTPTPEPTPVSEDREALVALYIATHGSNWTNNAKWLSDAPVGEWHGVRTNANGRVVELFLEGNNLNGELPAETGELSELRYLRLNKNGVRGTIPAEIGRLSELETLLLGDNDLMGELPAELASLSELVIFSAAGNRLTGAMPSWIGRLSNLERVALADNRFTGEIPSAFGDLSNLVLLRLYQNELTGNIPAELGSLSNLEWLDVSGNRLTGEMPVELSELSNLKELTLHSNRLSGEVPAELGKLAKLQRLRFDFNRLSGDIPVELGELSNLEVLLIAGNDELTGCIPDSLRYVVTNDLSHLALSVCSVVAAERAEDPERAALVAIYEATDGPNWHNNRNWLSNTSVGEWYGVRTNSNGRVVALEFNDNNLNGEIPPAIAVLSELTWVRLDKNGLRGLIPPEIGHLTNLHTLLMTDNDLEGELPSELASLSKLAVFSVGRNRLTGSIPPWIGDLSSLERVVLFHNEFSGEIPSAFGELSDLILLRLNDNELSGTLPAELGTLSRLEWLEISNNRLTGEIPSAFGELSDLILLRLNDNELSGTLPAELGTLSRLEWLEISNNRLTGEIPPELAELSNLTEMRLNGNRLIGEVPKELGRLTSLRNLRLDFNRLTGAIPPELGNLTNLEGFEILENNLSGEIPDEIGSLPNLRQIFVSRNAGISGCIPDGVAAIESTDLHDVDLPSCGFAEREVLTNLYEATDGVNWANSEGWLTGAPLDEWYGVTTNTYGRVVGIDLVGNNLSGEIPGGTGGLAKLEAVRLSGNSITGCLPISLSDLPTNDFGDLMLSECGVHFPDYWLKTAMLERLGKEPGAEIYVSDMEALESLDLSWSFIRDLEGLQYATNLTSLTLGLSERAPRLDEDGYSNKIENLAPLAQLTNLSELNLARCELTNVAVLSTLTNLKHLDVGFNRLRHVDPISQLYRLETLMLPSNQVEDISAVSAFADLTRLNVADNRIDDISPLAGLNRLQELDISYNDAVDFAAVSGLAQLQRLEMKGIGAEDLSPIKNLHDLTHLDASWNEVEDLSPLRGLAALDTLLIGPASISDVSALSDLSDLQQLRIVGTGLSDVSPLGDLRNLRSLVLSDNRISDLSPLSGLGDLEVLDLSFNQIEDVSPLTNLSGLKHLRLNGNRIRDIEPLVENRGLGDSDRVEFNEEVREVGANVELANFLANRGVAVEFGGLYATAFGQPQIHDNNLFILPTNKAPVGSNYDPTDYTSDFYKFFKDEFDFLMVISNIEFREDENRLYSGSYFAVSNDVEGIGIEPFRNEDWSSDARLQGVLDFPWREALGGGPVLHELMHRWGNRVVEPYPHWGFSSVNGHLGGFDIDTLEDLGRGRYVAWYFGPGGRAGDGDPYSALELYLAGLARAEEVPDWIAGVEANFAFTEEGRVEEIVGKGRVFTVKEFKTYSIDDVIAKHGRRIPDYSTSQKEFRSAAILLVDEDHPAMTEVVEEISRQVSRFSHPGDDEEWEYNFYEATRGRGTMLMGDLSEFLKDAEGE